MKTIPSTQDRAGKSEFLSDVKELRRRARQQLDAGAVTSGYAADRDTVLKLLNTALATELICVLRYRRHYFTASGIHAQAVAEEFLEHAQEEQAHADQIAQRIIQLGGAPDFNPDGLTARAHSEYSEVDDLAAMIQENLVAERIAIESYTEMIHYIGDDDPTTRRILEEILAKEEEHADELLTLIEGVSQHK
jgi:bacterioferritin